MIFSKEWLWDIKLIPDKTTRGHEKAILPISFHCGTHRHLAQLRKLENFFKIL